jgi:preprotein translocase subunit YajC
MFENFNLVLAMAAPGGSGQGGAGSMVPTLIMFGAIIVIMYFLMIRPQQKRAKEHTRMLESIKKGDKVVTTSGIHGTVTDMDGSTYVIQVSDNTKMTFEKASIATVKQ